MPDIRKVDMRAELARMEREVKEVNWKQVIPDDAYTSALLAVIPQSEIDAKWESLFSDVTFWSRAHWLLWLLSWKRVLNYFPKHRDCLLAKIKATSEYQSREDALWQWAAKKGGWCR